MLSRRGKKIGIERNMEIERDEKRKIVKGER